MRYFRLGVILLGVTLFILGCQMLDDSQGLDLDTTYFPFGLGYEWCYERHCYSYDDEGSIYDYYTKYTVKVIDSFWIGNTLHFLTDDTTCSGYSSEGLRDMPNPVSIWNDSIKIEMYGLRGEPEYSDTVSIVSPDTSRKGIWISYQEDTLKLESVDEIWPFTLLPGVGEIRNVTRVKGIGVIYQSYHFVATWPLDEYEVERLLYFYNGKDTVYRAEE